MSFSDFNFVAVLAAFIFGGLSFVSPCVLPLLPGYLSMMSGYSSEELRGGGTSTARMLRVTALFIAGFTVVFVAWGLGASWALPGNRWVAWAGWFVIAMGVFTFVTALWNPEFLLPLMRDRRLEVRPSRLGAWAPPVMGVAFGFGWTPCIGPTLGSIIAFTAADGSSVLESLVLLLAYSLGLAIPFLGAALGTNRVLEAYQRLRPHLPKIQATSGILLIGFGWLLVSGQIVELSNMVADFLDWVGLDSLSTI